MPCDCSNKKTNIIEEKENMTTNIVVPYNSFVKLINNPIIIDLSNDEILKVIINNTPIPKPIKYVIEGKYFIKSTTNILILGIPEIEFITNNFIGRFFNTKSI